MESWQEDTSKGSEEPKRVSPIQSLVNKINLANTVSKRPERDSIINKEDEVNIKILIGLYESNKINFKTMLNSL